MRIKSYVSEAIGTFLLLFIGCGAIVFFNDPLTVALSFGLVYFVLFYSFGNISGCHFNPIVSLSYVINKKISVLDFFGYFAGQLVGGLLGTFLIRIMLPNNFAPFNSYVTELCCNGDVIAAIFIEIILSYLFVLTFIGANSKSRNKNIRGLIICAGVVVVGLMGRVLNYSMVNPIKALTCALFNGSWKTVWLFVICPFIGSILATYNFNWFHRKDEEEN